MFLRKIAAAAAVLLLVSACSSAENVEPVDTASESPSPDTATATDTATARATDDTAGAEDEETTMGATARGEIGRLRVAVPEGWQEQVVEGQAFKLRYSDGIGEDVPTLSLSGDFGDYGTARVAMTTLIGDLQVNTPGFSVDDTVDVEIPGATSAVRLDFVYGTEETNGVFDGMWIVASDDTTDKTVAVALSATTLDGELRDQVQDSMVMLEP